MDDRVSPYPRGFLLSPAPTKAPPDYVPGPLLPNFYVHPWTVTEHATDGAGRFVIILGTCVSTVSEHMPGSSGVLLGALRVGDEELHRTLSEYSGRHVIIYGTDDHVRLLGDATGMRSIFYDPSSGVVASHALLVEQALSGDIDRVELTFQFGFPGNRTPYSRARLLPANTLYDLAERTVIRFWPLREPASRSVEAAAAELLERSVTALKIATQGRKVKLALTAGLDSRTVLAVALHAGIEFETYTYGQGPDTRLDRSFAVDLAQHAGVPHTVVPRKFAKARLRHALRDAHYSPHHVQAVSDLLGWIEDPTMTLAVTANLLEIGRSFYSLRRDSGVPAPTTAISMANLHYVAMGPRVRNQIDDEGRHRLLEVSVPAFQEFIETSQFRAGEGLIDPFDQFYWEHRMVAWHGAAMVERDFYGEPFIPFNSRAAFEAMLGVPGVDRESGAVQYELIRQVRSRLLDLPINPKQWPQAG